MAQNELKKQLEIYKSDLSSMEMECQKLNANLADAIRKEKDLVDNLDQQTNCKFFFIYFLVIFVLSGA